VRELVRRATGAGVSTPEHRRGAGARVDPRLMLLAAFLVGALVSGVAVGMLAHGSDHTAGVAAKTVADTSKARAKADARSGAASSSPSRRASASAAGAGDREQWAQMTEPLTQLQPGDRVVYNMNTCHFRSWVGGATGVALIACPGEQPFQTKTESLVPVEPATGD
jgi:hypothetical protein